MIETDMIDIDKMIESLIDEFGLRTDDSNVLYDTFISSSDVILFIKEYTRIYKWTVVRKQLPPENTEVQVVDECTGEIETAYHLGNGNFIYRDGRGHGAVKWRYHPHGRSNDD